MKQKTLDEVNNIMGGFDKEENKNIQAISNDPLEAMNLKMAELFSARINSIAKNETLATKIKEAFENQVENNELNFDQLLRLFKEINASNSIASEGILNLLKPGNGAENRLVNTLIDNNHKDNDKVKEFFDSLDKEDMEQIISLINNLKLLNEANNGDSSLDD